MTIQKMTSFQVMAFGLQARKKEEEKLLWKTVIYKAPSCCDSYLHLISE